MWSAHLFGSRVLPSTHDRFMCQHEIIFSTKALRELFNDTEKFEVIYCDTFLSLREGRIIEFVLGRWCDMTHLLRWRDNETS